MPRPSSKLNNGETSTPGQGYPKGEEGPDFIPLQIALYTEGNTRRGKCASESINHLFILVGQDELDFTIMKFIISKRTRHLYPFSLNSPHFITLMNTSWFSSGMA